MLQVEMEEKCMHVLACFILQNLLTQCTGDCRKVRFVCFFFWISSDGLSLPGERERSSYFCRSNKG